MSSPQEGDQRAAILMVPYVEIAEYRKLHPILAPLLEGVVGGPVFFIAHRRILRREQHGQRLLKQKRPVSRTLVRPRNPEHHTLHPSAATIHQLPVKRAVKQSISCRQTIRQRQTIHHVVKASPKG